MLTVDVENLPFVVRNRCLLQCWTLCLFCTFNSQHIYRNIDNTSLCKFHSTFCKFLQIQTLVFQHRSERRIKAELSSASLNLCQSNASYSQGEIIKDSFLSLSLSHWYHWLCRPNPVKLTPCGIKKNTQKCLKLTSPNWTNLLTAKFKRPVLSINPNWGT